MIDTFRLADVFVYYALSKDTLFDEVDLVDSDVEPNAITKIPWHAETPGKRQDTR